MFHAVVRIFLKIFELIGCIACVITKNLTDLEARRIEIRNQKYSREWSLLNNVTWSREGNAFASVTYGGYTLITALLLISKCVKSKARPTLTEKIFLTVGMLFFFTIGSLVYASIEQVPPDLHDNALILGTLSYLVAILYLIDLADPMERTTNRSTQTIVNDINYENFQDQQHHREQEQQHNQQQQQQQQQRSIITTNNIPTHINYQNPIKKNNNNNNNNKDIEKNKDHNLPSIQRIDLTPIPSPEIETIPNNGYYFPGDQVDIVQTKILPIREQPIFAKILLPEKQRPIKEKIIRPIRLYNGDDDDPVDDDDHKYRNYSTRSIENQFYRADARSHYNNMDYNNYKNYCKSYHKRYQSSTVDKDYFTDDDDQNIDRPLKSGFVAQAARMWDSKVKKTTKKQQTTIV